MSSYAVIQYDEYGRAYELGVPMGDRQLGGSVGPDRLGVGRNPPPLLSAREGEPMRNLQGKGFIVVSTDGSLISEEVPNYDDAVELAYQFLDAPKPGVVIYEAVGLIRPRRDVVARMTKRGAELEQQRKQKALPLSRDYEAEAQDEVNEIAPTDEPPKPAAP